MNDLPDYCNGVFKATAEAKIIIPENELRSCILANAAANLDRFQEQGKAFDLFPFFSILVSTGWNRNLDVFDPVELWRARHSPMDKPLNLNHNPKRICGHIIQNMVVGEDLKSIPDDTKESDLPYKLHIITANVLYSFWEDASAQEEIDTIIAEISEGKWFVSMECIFPSFDFALMNAAGEQKFIERNDQTKHLAKFLRQYKGSGRLHDYTIGRLLKNITFSAVGLVKKPANPSSVISDNLNMFTSLGYITLDQLQASEETSMPELTVADVENHPWFKDLKDKHEKLEQVHKAALEHHADVNKKLDDMKACMATKDDEAKKVEDEKAEANKTIAALKKTIADYEEDQTEAKKKAEALAGENDAMRATLKEFEAASRASARVAAMMAPEIGLNKEKAVAEVAKFADASDEIFKAALAMLINFKANAPKEVTPTDVLNNAKAEEDAQYGSTASVSEFQKVCADIKQWHVNKGEK